VSQTELVKNYSWLKGNLQYHHLDHSKGEAVGYYESGKIKFHYPLVDDKFHGICKSWHENGQLRHEEPYHRGLLEGINKEWYADGALEAETSYHGGLLDGLARRWYPNGVLASTWAHVRGNRHGPHREWQDNGNLRLEANYSNNLINGVMTKYNLEGKVSQKEVYVRGVIVKGEIKELLTNGKITAQHILKIRNTALRRVCLEELGYARFLSQVEHTVIEKEGDRELIRIEWLKREEPICLVKVKCPSTGVFYTLRVPPSMDTVKKAVAWTFGMKDKEYLPEQET